MGAFEGMDVAAVEAASGRLKAQAAVLEGVVRAVDGLVSQLSAVWHGSDAVSFVGWWQQQHRPALLSAAVSVQGLGVSAHNNATEQNTVSSPNGGSLGGVAAIAGLGAASALGGNGPALGPSQLLAFAKGSEGIHAALPPGWKPVSDSQLRGLGIDPRVLHDRGTGLDATIYSDGHGHYVISFGGTKGNLLGADWREDGKGVISSVIPNYSGQTEEAADLAHQLASRVGADNLTLTGHSLGGRDAAVASVASGSRAVTFNAAGVTDEDLVYARELSGHHVSLGGYVWDKVTGGESLRSESKQAQVTNYFTIDDPVTDGQGVGHTLGGPILGTREAFGVDLPVVPNTPDPLKAHDLSSFDGHL